MVNCPVICRLCRIKGSLSIHKVADFLHPRLADHPVGPEIGARRGQNKIMKDKIFRHEKRRWQRPQWPQTERINATGVLPGGQQKTFPFPQITSCFLLLISYGWYLFVQRKIFHPVVYFLTYPGQHVFLVMVHQNSVDQLHNAWHIASFIPRVVMAGVPTRMPEVTKGDLSSKGTMFLFTVISASTRAFSAMFTVNAFFAAQVNQHQVVVGAA